eukprot:CAMPEP_0177218418 /NCGR_PEP_ID=MMETSP0367-20130122/35812_1 /TAXON_ID=447022 ORGANISM="Scrippsiella hangoei-like, Strain SHHI-4" /NCGR_SAMPLE_ID=MMETSP0367 /ASSEMBLY_ACC=CAM_ASM_000362 /LENGTH=47 /DNA_ID= /DNA_START= /DNA_END= /DNA_ORIENTATION=
MAHGISTANMSFPRWGGESQWVGAQPPNSIEAPVGLDQSWRQGSALF